MLMPTPAPCGRAFPIAISPDKDIAMNADTTQDIDTSAGEQAQPKASQLCDMIEDIAKTVPEAAREKLESLKQEVTALCERGKDTAEHLARKLTRTVKDYPVQTAVAAVGAGLLTWWFLSRRR
jgi:hypothetical protein